MNILPQRTTTQGNPQLDRLTRPIVRPGTLLTVGIFLLLTGLLMPLRCELSPQRLMSSYLVSFCFFTSLSLGAIFFVLLQHLTRAQWSVVVRRLAETTMTGILASVFLFLPIGLPLLFGSSVLYEWNDASLRASDPLVAGKAAYLNGPFFVLRGGLYFFVWTLIARRYIQLSIRQDEHRDASLTHAMRRTSGPAMLAFALTVNFAAFDWIMSLDPHWFSTIFGIYFFSGSVVGFLSFLIIAIVVLQQAGRLQEQVTVEHRHDIGKHLLGFTLFWAYIAFSQYLLIWYANIPEETGWYFVRQNNGWQTVSLILIIGHFILPFAALLSRRSKRRTFTLCGVATWLLAMHWVDLWWLVMPSIYDVPPNLGVVDLLTFVGIASVWSAIVLRRLTGIRLSPCGDPKYHASLNFHNM